MLLPDEPLPGESQSAFKLRHLTRQDFEDWVTRNEITPEQQSRVLAALADAQQMGAAKQRDVLAAERNGDLTRDEGRREFAGKDIDDELRGRLSEILGDALARDFERKVGGNLFNLRAARIVGYRAPSE